MHYCTGTAQAYFSGTSYKQLADQYGFIVIYPEAPDSGKCWDVASANTLKHNAGGDSLSIVNMVKYTLSTYSGNASRVFATGTSSGAMMTNVLMGAYPDVFAGGAAFAGVPYGCFAGNGMWNSQCATGQLSKTAAAWGDAVRNAYPGFTGERPKMAIYHGTNDETLNYNNFKEAVKQWTNVFGYSESSPQVLQNNPVSGWTKSVYGPKFMAISAQGVSHNIAVQANDVIAYFGLNSSGTPTSTPGTSPTSTPVVTPTSTPVNTPTPTSGAGTVPKWGQCGGQGWTGGTVCQAGSTCKASNQWYSQCL